MLDLREHQPMLSSLLASPSAFSKSLSRSRQLISKSKEAIAEDIKDLATDVYGGKSPSDVVFTSFDVVTEKDIPIKKYTEVINFLLEMQSLHNRISSRAQTYVYIYPNKMIDGHLIRSASINILRDLLDKKMSIHDYFYELLNKIPHETDPEQKQQYQLGLGLINDYLLPLFQLTPAQRKTTLQRMKAFVTSLQTQPVNVFEQFAPDQKMPAPGTGAHHDVYKDIPLIPIPDKELCNICQEEVHSPSRQLLRLQCGGGVIGPRCAKDLPNKCPICRSSLTQRELDYIEASQTFKSPFKPAISFLSPALPISLKGKEKITEQTLTQTGRFRRARPLTSRALLFSAPITTSGPIASTSYSQPKTYRSKTRSFSKPRKRKESHSPKYRRRK